MSDEQDIIPVPRELLILWHRVMAQNPGEYEDQCRYEMWELLNKKGEYDVWVEMVPHFSAISKT